MSHIIEEVTVGDRGRVVLPAAVRSALGFRAGTKLLVRVEDDGSLLLRPYRLVAETARGLFAGPVTDHSLVDDLQAERRAEAARES
jgi:AbrB family looped-hinge helix DNA binding protein